MKTPILKILQCDGSTTSFDFHDEFLAETCPKTAKELKKNLETEKYKLRKLNFINVYGKNGIGKTSLSNLLLEKLTSTLPEISIDESITHNSYSTKHSYSLTNSYVGLNLNNFFKNQPFIYDYLIYNRILHDTLVYDLKNNIYNLEIPLDEFSFHYYNHYVGEDKIFAGNSFLDDIMDIPPISHGITFRYSIIFAIEFYSSLLKTNVFDFLNQLENFSSFSKIYKLLKKTYGISYTNLNKINNSSHDTPEFMMKQFILLRKTYLKFKDSINKIFSYNFIDGTKKEILDINNYFDENSNSIFTSFSSIFPNIKFIINKRYNSILDIELYDIKICSNQYNKIYSNSTQFLHHGGSEGEKTIYNLLKLSIGIQFINYKQNIFHHNFIIQKKYLIIADDLFSSLDHTNLTSVFNYLFKIFNETGLLEKIFFINLTHDFNLFDIISKFNFSHKPDDYYQTNIILRASNLISHEISFNVYNVYKNIKLKELPLSNELRDIHKYVFEIFSNIVSWRQQKEEWKKPYDMSNPFFHTIIKNQDFLFNKAFKYFNDSNFKFLHVNIYNTKENTLQEKWLILLCYIYKEIELDNLDISNNCPDFFYFKALIYRKIFEHVSFKYLLEKEKQNFFEEQNSNKNFYKFKNVENEIFKNNEGFNWSELKIFNETLINEILHSGSKTSYKLQQQHYLDKFFKKYIEEYASKYSCVSYEFIIKEKLIKKYQKIFKIFTSNIFKQIKFFFNR